MKKHLVISMALTLSATQLFGFTPHINKGRIEEISVAQACAEMKIPEAELKELNKDFYGVMEDNNDFPASVKVTQDSPIQIFRQTFAETDEVLYRVFSKAIETNDGTPCMFQKGYYVQKIYKGSKYSDTCIAELHFFNEKMKWLFGGVE